MKQQNLLEHKVGIRILHENTLENIFPMYRSMMNKIHECRRAASEQSQKSIKRHYQYNYMFDNVFSILGKRGTGKTTVAFSLREMIEKNKESSLDVVLPIIIPEVIPDNCTILGWILAIIKEEVEHLDSLLKKQEEHDRKEDYWSTCRYSDGVEQLSEKLNRLCRMVFAGKYNPGNENSYYQAVGNSAVQAEEYYQFAVEIAEFWDMWLDAIKRLNKQNQGNEQKIEPMIYFIFDDVDLAPEKIGELLSVIIKYLSHPNIIVITTADERLILEVLENRMDRNIGKLPKEWRGYLANQGSNEFYYEEGSRNEKDLVDETARMYMGKVMPPSMRFYLRTFHTASQKAHFLMSESQTLGEEIREQVERLLHCAPKERKRSLNFMGEKNKIRDFYLNFFGDTSRQIGNIYLGIRMLIDNLLEEVGLAKKGRRRQEAYLSKIHEYCAYFINLVIRTNHGLGSFVDTYMDIDKFVDEMFMTEYQGRRLYVNYAYLDEFTERNMDNDQKKLSLNLQFYSLAAFVEGVLLILEFCTKNGVRGRKRIHVVRPLAAYLNRTIFEERYIFRDDLDAGSFFSHYGFLLDRLEQIPFETYYDQRIDMEYFSGLQNEEYEGEQLKFFDLLHMYQENQSWFREMVGMIAMTYGSGYLVDQKAFKAIMPLWDEKTKLGYQVFAEQRWIENIKDYVIEFDLYNAAKGFIEKIIELPYDYEDEKHSAYILKVKSELLNKMPGEEDGADQNFIPLATVLQSMVNVHGSIEEMLENCSKETIDDLREVLGMGLFDDKDVQDLLQKEMDRLEKMESMVNYVAFYYPQNWLEVISELRKNESSSMRKKVRRLTQSIGWIFVEEDIEVTEQIIVPYGPHELLNLRVLCGELARDLKSEENVFSERALRDLKSEENVLSERVLSLANDLDIAVDITNPIQLERAVNTGFHLLVVEYLQRLYLSLKIVEHYENGSIYSGKNIQWIFGKEGEKEAYYYQIFQVMKETAEGTVVAGKRQKRKKEELRYLIEKITRDRRRNYIDELQRERPWIGTD